MMARCKTGKNRMHLDCHPDDPEAHITRLRRLGATVVGERVERFGHWWQVMADPEGNEFCVLEPRDIYRDTGPVAAILNEEARAPFLRDWYKHLFARVRDAAAKGINLQPQLDTYHRDGVDVPTLPQIIPSQFPAAVSAMLSVTGSIRPPPQSR